MCWVMPPASPGHQVGVPDRVQELGLAVVDVTHDRDHRRPGHQVGVAALVLAELDVERLQQLPVLFLRGDDLDGVVELGAQQLQRLVVHRLGRGHHLTEVEHDLDQRRRVGADLVREVRQRRAAGQPDDLPVTARNLHAANARGLHVVELLPPLPLRLAGAARPAAGTPEGALRATAATTAATRASRGTHARTGTAAGTGTTATRTTATATATATGTATAATRTGTTGTAAATAGRGATATAGPPPGPPRPGPGAGRDGMFIGLGRGPPGRGPPGRGPPSPPGPGTAPCGRPGPPGRGLPAGAPGRGPPWPPWLPWPGAPAGAGRLGAGVEPMPVGVELNGLLPGRGPGRGAPRGDAGRGEPPGRWPAPGPPWPPPAWPPRPGWPACGTFGTGGRDAAGRADPPWGRWERWGH